jgi:hydrogenase nickel incorporation protein HypB
MCGTCGCGQTEHPPARASDPGAAHAAEHARQARRVEVERSLLEHNQRHAEALARRLAGRGIDAIGLLGGPGAGKTALLEAGFRRRPGAAGREAVVEGDCAGDLDARRVAACGARVAQVATGAVCHLDAHLVEHALEGLDLAGVSRLWIENVGNLVCPAPFACGEGRRAVLVSVTEGDDKPAKYPAVFAAVDCLVISKTDLLPHVDFDVARCVAAAREANPSISVVTLSSRSGEGLDAWLDWVDRADRVGQVGQVGEVGEPPALDAAARSAEGR